MPEMIVMSAALADAIEGPTTPGRALDPRDIGGGVFVLPLAVLADDHGAEMVAFLSALTRQVVTLPAPDPQA